MSIATPLATIPVGFLVERSKSRSQWAGVGLRAWGGRPGEPGTAADVRGVKVGEGAMGPKVGGAGVSVEATGATAHIGGRESAEGLLIGRSGTTIIAD